MTPSRFFPPADSREYKLFISHAWDYSDDYNGVVDLLKADSSFKWVDLSVTIDEPLPVIVAPWLSKSYRCIVHQLDEKIREADCVLVLAAMYFNHRGWLQSEIEAAREFKKPIIAVRPLGQERVPEGLNQEGITLVGWRTDSIISAIRNELARPIEPSPLAILFGLTESTPPPPLTPFSQSALLLAALESTPPAIGLQPGRAGSILLELGRKHQ